MLLFGSLVALLAGCGPYSRWPDQDEVFPWVVTPQTDLEPYEEVRWETETWSPEDVEMTGLYLQKAFFHRPGAPVEVLAHYDAMRQQIPSLVSDPAGPTFAFVGDIMYVEPLETADWSTYTQATTPLFDHADLRVGNLETPTSDAHPTDARALGTYAFNADPAMLDGLPMDILQLNNNHSLDAGDEGLANTVDALRDRALVPTGVGGIDGLDAFATAEDTTFLAYTWGMNDQRRSEVFELHIVPFGHLDADPIPLDAIAADIDASQTEHVVVMLHWGFEYEYYPDPHFLKLARRIVAMGADLVVGHGPHVVQPPELCHVDTPEIVPAIGTCSVRSDDPDGAPRTAAILYSLGNFGTEMPTLPCQVGIIATAQLGASGVEGLGWTPVAAIASDGRPLVVPLDALLDPESAFAADDPVAIQEELDRLTAHLGASWQHPPR
jgi:poly-gamma-glutamate synthesis protein (capsule biosynthesis protein)